MTKRILVVMMALVLCAPTAQAGLSATGDVDPPDPATWTDETIAYIGLTGEGSVAVDADSDLLSASGVLGFVSGSTGVVTVDGAGSTWGSGGLSVGHYGDGTLAISAGGAVDSSYYTYIARYGGASGAATVSGTDSTWTSSALTVGEEGDGTLDITAGGVVTSTDGMYGPGGFWSYVGRSSGSTGVVTVSGAGSTWASLCGLQVGGHGDGAMHITAGGVVNSGAGTYSNIGCYIGYEAGSTGVVTVSGAGSMWINSGDGGSYGSLRVGHCGDGALNISDGGEVRSRQGRVGLSTMGLPSGSTGVVTVSGAGSTWTNSTDVKVGRYGSGTLSITDGGTVVSGAFVVLGSSSGPGGAVTVSGQGSTLTGGINVNRGTLDITAGGAVSSGEGGYISGFSGFASVVTVDGGGSTWASPDGLYVGFIGTGTLAITNGGAVSSCSGMPGSGNIGSMGHEPGSTGVMTVSGAGSTWTNHTDTYVGYHGSGTLTIADGGAVSNEKAYIGYEAGSTGAVTVSGPGVTWTNSGALNVGAGGEGTLTVTDGGTVSSAYGFVGSPTSPSGEVTVSGAGSAWTGSTWLFLSGTGALRLYDGGTASAAVSVFDSGATLNIGLSGAAVESCLNVTGSATLAGALDVNALPSLALAPGAEFLVLDASALSGTFDTFSFPNAQEWYIDYNMPAGDVSVGFVDWSAGNFDQDQDIDDVDIDLLGDAIRLGSADFSLFDITADGTTGGADGVIDILDLDYLVRFLVETAIGSGTEYGDFNLDGLVDTTDLTRLAADYGSGDTWAKGNASRNIDLITDTMDLTILATYYGFGVPDIVPEPATLFVMGCGAIGLLRRRRRT